MLVMSFARCSSRRCVSFEVPSVSAASAKCATAPYGTTELCSKCRALWNAWQPTEFCMQATEPTGTGPHAIGLRGTLPDVGRGSAELHRPPGAVM